MTFADLVTQFRSWGDAPALLGEYGDATYVELADLIEGAKDLPAPGSVVEHYGDFGPSSVARLLALWSNGNIVIPKPLTREARVAAGCLVPACCDAPKPSPLAGEGGVRGFQGAISFEGSRDSASPQPSPEGEGAGTSTQGRTSCGYTSLRDVTLEGDVLEILRARHAPGLILFTSGTTGDPKAVVHDAGVLLRKIAKPGRTHRTLAFLGFDHIGGINTLLYGLTHGGCLVSPNDRSPSAVLAAVAEYGVELLPTTPSFLRLLLLDGALERYDHSSLKLITYGSEPMPESTLLALNAALPRVPKLQQFGMSELGVLRSRSREDGSTWMRLGGPEFDIRVVDGRLEVRAETAMLGYLNAPSPFTEDGWLRTGDLAEQDGEWIRILGRASEVVNVGGEKVHPVAVESVLESMPGVAYAAARGEANAILGQTVAVRVRLTQPEPIEDFRRRLRAFCAGRLPRHAIPTRIELTEEVPAGKKRRAA